MLEARRLQDPELQEGTCVHLKTPQAHKGHHPPPAASAALIDVTAPFLKGLFFPLEKSSLKSSFVKGSGDILKMLTRWIIFFFYSLSMQSKEETKRKVQGNVNTLQHSLPLTSQFRFSMKSRGVFGDRHGNTCTHINKPSWHLFECQSATLLTQKIYSMSAFSFPLAKGGWVSWSIQIGTPTEISCAFLWN